MNSSFASYMNLESPDFHGGSSIFMIFLFLLLLLFLFLFLKLTKIYKRTKPKLPPTPSRLPLIGNLHLIGSHPHRSLRALSQKHGPLMLLKLGWSKTLVISSRDVAQEMVKAHDIAFSNRPETTAAKTLIYGCKDIGFSP